MNVYFISTNNGTYLNGPTPFGDSHRFLCVSKLTDFATLGRVVTLLTYREHVYNCHLVMSDNEVVELENWLSYAEQFAGEEEKIMPELKHISAKTKLDLVTLWGYATSLLKYGIPGKKQPKNVFRSASHRPTSKKAVLASWEYQG